MTLGVENSNNPAGLIAQMLAAFSSLVVSFGVLFQVGRVARQTTATAAQVNGLANGVGDAKFKAAAHAAMEERDQSSAAG